MKRSLVLLVLLLLTAEGQAWAKEKDAPFNADNTPSRLDWSEMDVDKQVDDGAGDDKGDPSAEPNKFEKDKDDSYQDASTGQDDWLKSIFKEDGDNDVDTETDTSDLIP